MFISETQCILSVCCCRDEVASKNGFQESCTETVGTAFSEELIEDVRL